VAGSYDTAANKVNVNIPIALMIYDVCFGRTDVDLFETEIWEV
jgi:hypothetical protein